MNPQLVRRLVVPALSILLTLGAGCRAESPVISGPTASPTERPAGDGPASPTPPDDRAEEARMDLADGRHPVFIEEVNLARGTMVVDVIQFLTGEEARQAYLRDHPDDPDGPPNDYYILNTNPRLRSGVVAAGAPIRLVKMEQTSSAELEDADLNELAEFVRSIEPSVVPFWITVAGGQITAVEEQYVP